MAMEKISDTVTSVFHVPIKDKRPVACPSGDGAISWSDTFGLGWRFGISYNPNEWFAKVRLYLDHNHSLTEGEQAIVNVTLRNSTDKDAKGLKERVTTITDFGHGQPALLGSWYIADLSLQPYVSLTLTTKTRIPQLVADPLSSATLALIRQSMDSGDFVDTKFYVFSAKRSGTTAGKPRVLHVNNNSIGLVLPKTTSGVKQANGLAPSFLVNMTGDHHINGDSVLHEYDYEQDSDLDDEEGEDDTDNNSDFQPSSIPGEFQTGSTSKLHARKPSLSQDVIPSSTEDEFSAEPPPYSASSSRMILVKGVAYKTWATYIYFRYTGRVSFLPLKSSRGPSRERPNDAGQPPKCSPKSMYRLAHRLGDERMTELAFCAIKEGISENNVVGEAFTWFSAQYPAIVAYEVDRVSELRKSPKVKNALRVQVKSVSIGEKPWANGVLIAIMDKLNPST